MCYMAVPLPGMLLPDNGNERRALLSATTPYVSLRLLETLLYYRIYGEIWSLSPTRQEPPALLKGAMYNFIMARVLWTLCLHDKSQDAKKLESEADMYFYQTMRFAATYAATKSSKTLPSSTYSTDAPVISEELDRSFLPMLYITGQCSPQPSWLRWIAQLMKQIGEQGLFNGFVLSASLQVLHKMELSENLLSTDRIDR
ncbi:hypothetical protein J3F83DRAFT_724501 [Trichoderma novae-zelandiae]